MRGAGTQENPYRPDSVAEFIEAAQMSGAFVVLDKDLKADDTTSYDAISIRANITGAERTETTGTPWDRVGMPYAVEGLKIVDVSFFSMAPIEINNIWIKDCTFSSTGIIREWGASYVFYSNHFYGYGDTFLRNCVISMQIVCSGQQAVNFAIWTGSSNVHFVNCAVTADYLQADNVAGFSDGIWESSTVELKNAHGWFLFGTGSVKKCAVKGNIDCGSGGLTINSSQDCAYMLELTSTAENPQVTFGSPSGVNVINQTLAGGFTITESASVHALTDAQCKDENALAAVGFYVERVEV